MHALSGRHLSLQRLYSEDSRRYARGVVWGFIIRALVRVECITCARLYNDFGRGVWEGGEVHVLVCVEDFVVAF